MGMPVLPQLHRVYISDPLSPRRRKTRVVRIGDVAVGGENPVRIQSMTVADTMDTEAVVKETIGLVNAGCEIVRITAPRMEEARNLGVIKAELLRRGITVPLVADIHFQPQAAMEAALHVEKVRINPGNFVDRKRFAVVEYSESEYQEELERLHDSFKPLVLLLKERGRALRIGTNHGSLSDRIMNRYGDTPLGMVESALEFIRICEMYDYGDIIVSMKASNPQVMVQAYRMLCERFDQEGMHYPLHLGVTEAGLGEDGRIKSAIGIGSLLDDGIGDTIRVSLTEDSVREIPAAKAIAACFPAGPVKAHPENAATQEADAAYRRMVDPYSYARMKRHRVTFGSASIGALQPVKLGIFVSEADLSARKIGPWHKAGADVFFVPHSNSLPDLSSLGAPVVVETDAAATLKIPKGAAGISVNVSADSDPSKTTNLLSEWERICSDAGIGLLVKACLDPHTSEFPWHVLNALDSATAVAVSSPGRPSGLAPAVRAMVTQSRTTGSIVLCAEYDDLESALISGSFQTGGLLLDGIGDLVLVKAGKPDDSLRLGLNILQACRLRMSRAEFISCPSCGRTLFDLQETTARIQSRTGHLKGVKIAVMGCIVNGPGEMADADFGYVGAGPGLIHLYRGKDVVRRNVPSGEADEALVGLIREHGMWIDPE